MYFYNFRKKMQASFVHLIIWIVETSFDGDDLDDLVHNYAGEPMAVRGNIGLLIGNNPVYLDVS